MKVILAQPRGFCAGVQRAVDIVERALALFGPPIYVRHEIVHNAHVVGRLRAKGVHFVDDLSDVPTGSVTIFSAHGVSSAVERDAKDLGLRVIDATCPLVNRVHLEAIRYARAGHEVVLIGHAGHAEVEGTLGRLEGGRAHLVSGVEDVATLSVSDPEKVAYVTQTTLSVDDTRAIIDALTARFPAIKGPDTKDICYATQNRQRAVRDLAAQVDVLLVVGSANSSNSNRLWEIAQAAGTKAYRIDDADGMDPAWLEGASAVGITAGASAPDDLVQGLVDRIGSLFKINLSILDGVEEDVHFRLPPEVAHGGSSAEQTDTPAPVGA
ncbi:4-hydroxy-3-methylbut-2-enyl diphosphate reductase [Azospirillum rugosum]|uniref:4-hydroxy-3-methylbut-2-enyl diphosphate reductase n=1 Tax=Azospirillum rugosum TaxID=416170 RepID=UPI001AE6DC80|nr:4-hydroxy-3-methylbut-2-enyl diphosphate reductase [Azospirillum rugosum]